MYKSPWIRAKSDLTLMIESGYNTDFIRAAARHRSNPDGADAGSNLGRLGHGAIREKYSRSGYPMPVLAFLNVACRELQSPTLAAQEGVVLVNPQRLSLRTGQPDRHPAPGYAEGAVAMRCWPSGWALGAFTVGGKAGLTRRTQRNRKRSILASFLEGVAPDSRVAPIGECALGFDSAGGCGKIRA